MMPSHSPSRSLLIDRLPLVFALPYLLTTYVLFILGPYVWPVREWWVIYLYVPSAFALLTIGFFIGSSGPAKASELPTAKRMFWLGGLGALILLAPTTVTYTGKMPWELSGALQDQREAYSALAEQLATTAGNRGLVALARALAGPFTFCVVPIAILFWGRLSRLEKALAVATILVGFDLSILRGTTAQLADLFVIGASASLIRIGLTARIEGVQTIFKRWKAFAFAALALSLVIVVLIGRTEARLGGRTVSCIGQSGACADLSNGWYGSLNESIAFGSAAVTGYFSQGYYGLALAAEKPFEPTWGIGHSPVASALFVMAGGNEQFANRTYTFRARADGWSDETQWSGLITWLANDAGLWGALVVLVFIGWIWGKSWIDASRGGDIRAAILFCVVMMMIFYLPANNYVMATYEGYMTLVFWAGLWAWGRGKRPKINSLE